MDMNILSFSETSKASKLMERNILGSDLVSEIRSLGQVLDHI